MPGGGGSSSSKDPSGQVHALQSCKGTCGRSASRHSPVVCSLPLASTLLSGRSRMGNVPVADQQ